MASLSITVVDKTKLTVAFVDFAGAEATADIQNIDSWDFKYKGGLNLEDLDDDLIPDDDEPEDINILPGAKCIPFSIKAYSTGLGAEIVMHPEYSPASTYTLTYKSVDPDVSADVAIPASLLPEKGEGEFPKGPLQVLTQCVGEELHVLYGRPHTLLLKDFKPLTETIVYTETTLGWPSKGAIWITDKLFTYSSKFDGGFIGVTLKDPVSIKHPKSLYKKWVNQYFDESIPTSSIVALQVSAVPPSDLEFDVNESGA